MQGCSFQTSSRTRATRRQIRNNEKHRIFSEMNSPADDTNLFDRKDQDHIPYHRGAWEHAACDGGVEGTEGVLVMSFWRDYLSHGELLDSLINILLNFSQGLFYFVEQGLISRLIMRRFF